MDVHVQKALDSSEAESGRQFSCAVSPIDGASFLLLGDQNAVFCEPTQKIYALNNTAAYIWCRLEEHQSPDSICDELTRSGISPGLARKYVQQALRNWLKLGLLKVDCDFDNDTLHFERSFNLSVAGFNVTIRISSERLAQSLTLFDHHISLAKDCGNTFLVIEIDDLVYVIHNRVSVICCDAIELAPSIKAYIAEQIVKMSPPNVVFHAACLVRGEKCILISGRPGAGKTTLALRLAEAGFEYAGDDIVLIAPDGGATGVPFAPTVKPGAWEIVNRFRPNLSDAIVHRRPDGVRVRYLSPVHTARNGRYPVGWVIFIKRAFGPTTLKPLGQVHAMRRLIEGSYSPGRRMNLAGCNAIKRTLATANSFELTYANLAEANDNIVRLCNG